METAYFLDTYALIEITKNNENFKEFLETSNSTSFMNLLELHYILSKDFGEKRADEIVDELKDIVIDIEVGDIKRASKFRLVHIKNKFSYIDSLGYTMAMNGNMKFLTGDKEFENLDNVEFVK